jgi:uncharacterized phage protein (TIGR02220 family)
MARHCSNTVDYFPHVAKSGKTIAILEGKWGILGYAFWFKLLEGLCCSDNHYLDFNDVEIWQYFISRIPIEEDKADEILRLLANLGNIDSDLWSDMRIVWCQALVDNLEIVYKNRRRPIPKKPNFPILQEGIQVSDSVPTDINDISTGRSTHSIVEYSIVENTLSGKPDSALISEVVQYLNTKTGREFKTKSTTTTSHIRARSRDGFSLSDFKAVIDSKVKEWGGDPKMAPYLRPETLFGTKFESYVQVARSGKTINPQVIREKNPACDVCGTECEKEYGYWSCKEHGRREDVGV